MHIIKTAIAGSLLCVNLYVAPAAGQTSGWRGDGTGRFPFARVVESWDAADNVIWRVATPEWSNASPVLSGNRVFICAEPDTLICIDGDRGEILWQRSNSYVDIAPQAQREAITAGMAAAEALNREQRDVTRSLRRLRQQARDDAENTELRARIEALEAEAKQIDERLGPLEAYRLPSTHNANGYSSPTPVTDGSRVYVFFGTGVAAAYDFDGNRIWARVLEKPTAGWGHSASPVLAAGHFIIHIRSVHALDMETGETVWTAPSRERWGSSVTAEIDGQDVVITANGEIIRAADGEILASGMHRLDYCAPLVHDGVVYFIEHGGKAFRLPAKADGVEAPEELWQTTPPRDRYYASPLYHEGRIYSIHQKGMYSVIDAATGEVLKSENVEDLRRTVYTSVTLAGPYILLGSEGGNIVLKKPGIEMRRVAGSRLDTFRSTPVFDQQRAYIRTRDALYCIGN